MVNPAPRQLETAAQRDFFKRVLDRLDIPQSLVGEWQGTRPRAQASLPGA